MGLGEPCGAGGAAFSVRVEGRADGLEYAQLAEQVVGARRGVLQGLAQTLGDAAGHAQELRWAPLIVKGSTRAVMT